MVRFYCVFIVCLFCGYILLCGYCLFMLWLYFTVWLLFVYFVVIFYCVVIVCLFCGYILLCCYCLFILWLYIMWLLFVWLYAEHFRGSLTYLTSARITSTRWSRFWFVQRRPITRRRRQIFELREYSVLQTQQLFCDIHQFVPMICLL